MHALSIVGADIPTNLPGRSQGTSPSLPPTTEMIAEAGSDDDDDGIIVQRLSRPSVEQPLPDLEAARSSLLPDGTPISQAELTNRQSVGKFKSKYAGKLDKTSFLGKGKFSQVFKCTRKGSKGGATYAVKVIEKKGLTAKQLNEIEKEASICQLISHGNIMKIYDFYNEKKKNYLVFEIISGGELFDYIVAQDDGISEQQSSKWFIEVLSALKYCHSRGVVHRDLKLENLMLTGPNTVKPNSIKIVDFGLAAIITKPAKLGVVGSANYMAPEVANDLPYGKAIDVWSCGVILYILLSGIMPFLGDSQAETLELVKKGKYSFPKADFSGVSSGAKELVSLMLQFDPLSRISVGDALEHTWTNGGASRIKRRGSVMSLRKSKSTRRKSIRLSSEALPGFDAKSTVQSSPARMTEVTGIMHDMPLQMCRFCVDAATQGSYLVKVAPKTGSFNLLVKTGKSVREFIANVDNGGNNDGIILHGMRFAGINELVRGFNRLKIPDTENGGTVQIRRSANLWLTSAPPDQCERDLQFAGAGKFLVHHTGKGYFLCANDNGQGIHRAAIPVAPNGTVQWGTKKYKTLEDFVTALPLNPFPGSFSSMPIVATDSPYAEH